MLLSPLCCMLCCVAPDSGLRMDVQILPALYNALGKAFNASPTELGYLTLARALVQALSSPLGGIAGGAAPHLLLMSVLISSEHAETA